jgi:hypothetical protein
MVLIIAPALIYLKWQDLSEPGYLYEMKVPGTNIYKFPDTKGLFDKSTIPEPVIVSWRKYHIASPSAPEGAQHDRYFKTGTGHLYYKAHYFRRRKHSKESTKTIAIMISAGFFRSNNIFTMWRIGITAQDLKPLRLL